MSREFKVRASNLYATYNAGRFVAESAQEACDMARESYKQSTLGRQLEDAGALRFFTVDKFPYEEDKTP